MLVRHAVLICIFVCKVQNCCDLGGVQRLNTKQVTVGKTHGGTLRCLGRYRDARPSGQEAVDEAF